MSLKDGTLQQIFFLNVIKISIYIEGVLRSSAFTKYGKIFWPDLAAEEER